MTMTLEVANFTRAEARHSGGKACLALHDADRGQINVTLPLYQANILEAVFGALSRGDDDVTDVLSALETVLRLHRGVVMLEPDDAETLENAIQAVTGWMEEELRHVQQRLASLDQPRAYHEYDMAAGAAE